VDGVHEDVTQYADLGVIGANPPAGVGEFDPPNGRFNFGTTTLPAGNH